MTRLLVILITCVFGNFAWAENSTENDTIEIRILSKYHPQNVRIETRTRVFHFFPGQGGTFEHEAEAGDDISVTVNNKITRVYRGTIKLNWKKNEYQIINETALETYIAGVVIGELGANAPHELIKAQAILARTYARKVSAREQLFDLAYHQVFTGFDRYAVEAYRQTTETKGQYLWQDGHLSDALFHAQCGSAIYASGQFWRSDRHFNPVLLPVEMDAGELWSTILSSDQLKAVFAHANALQRTMGQPEQIRVDEEYYVVEKFRLKINRKYGWNTLPSNEFKISRTSGGYRFQGRGHGHLVGLCQQQASALASRGWSARQLLTTFYPNSAIR